MKSALRILMFRIIGMSSLAPVQVKGSVTTCKIEKSLNERTLGHVNSDRQGN